MMSDVTMPSRMLSLHRAMLETVSILTLTTDSLRQTVIMINPQSIIAPNI